MITEAQLMEMVRRWESKRYNAWLEVMGFEDEDYAVYDDECDDEEVEEDD